jgi:DNA primase
MTPKGDLVTAPRQEYHDPTHPPTPSQPKRRHSRPFQRQLEAVKTSVRIEQVAQEYGEHRLLGNGRLLGRCVSPSHEDKTPSMTVYTETQTFKCYGIGCGAQGDVLDLVQLAEGCELWEAMMLLSQRYDIELPGRPRSWFTKQERQQPIRDAIDRERFDHLRRRLFRWFFEPALLRIEDPEERKAEAVILWEATEPLAEMALERMWEVST